jgi:hypothetical protein
VIKTIKPQRAASEKCLVMAPSPSTLQVCFIEGLTQIMQNAEVAQSKKNNDAWLSSSYLAGKDLGKKVDLKFGSPFLNLEIGRHEISVTVRIDSRRLEEAIGRGADQLEAVSQAVALAFIMLDHVYDEFHGEMFHPDGTRYFRSTLSEEERWKITVAESPIKPGTIEKARLIFEEERRKVKEV